MTHSKTKFAASGRSSGVLLHPTSLPGPFGIGDIGPAAIQWIRTLARAGQTWWQFLPLGPPAAGNSPYQCFSAFAGNPSLISPQGLVRDNLLPRRAESAALRSGPVSYERVVPWKEQLLTLAWERFREGSDRQMREALAKFSEEQSDWLDDFALFMALKEEHGGLSWTQWPRELVARRPAAPP